MTNFTQSPFEKHAQTILAGVIVILISWVGFSVNQLGNQMVRLEEQMSSSQQTASNQYARLQRHDDSIQNLVIRVDRLERAQ